MSQDNLSLSIKSQSVPSVQSMDIYQQTLNISQFSPNDQIRVKYFECLLCHGIAYSAISCPSAKCNGHLICKTCFDVNVKSNSKDGKNIFVCPISGEETEAKFNQLPFFNIFENMEIACKNLSKNCDFKGSISEYLKHIKEDCLKEEIQCKFNGCNQKDIRESIIQHEKECEYQQVECTYCGIKILKKDLNEHHKNCLKFPVDCPQNCNIKIPNSDIQKHIDNDCPNTIINCPLIIIGCNQRVERKNINNHFNNELYLHFYLLSQNQINFQKNMESKLDQLNSSLIDFNNSQLNRNSSLDNISKNYEDTLNDMKNSLNQIKDGMGFLKNFIFDKCSDNSSNIGSLAIKDKISQPSLYYKMIQNQTFNLPNNIQNNEVEFLKKKRLFCTSKNDDSINIDNNKETDSSTSKDKISNQTISQNGESIFDMKYLPKGVIINGNVLLYDSIDNKNQHKYIFSHQLKKDEITKFEIKIRKLKNAWVMFGLCDKGKVIQNGMKFFNIQVPNFYNATFGISTNVYVWNANKKEENNRYMSESFKFKSGINLNFIYNPKEKVLFIKSGDLNLKLTDVRPILSDELSITIILLNGEVELELNKIE